MGRSDFVFEEFVLTPSAGTLLKSGFPQSLSHRGYELLLALTEEPGRVLTKGELMDRAWPGQAVAEGNLTVQIAALRKLLGNNRHGQEWITTVHRVGYRFAANAPELPPRVAETPVVRKPSLAVLPFDAMGGGEF